MSDLGYEWDFPPIYKWCSLCRQDKPLKAFNKNVSGIKGRQGNCRECTRALLQAKKENLDRYEFMCGQCGLTHRMSNHQIAQLLINEKISFECSCGGITLLDRLK